MGLCFGDFYMNKITHFSGRLRKGPPLIAHHYKNSVSKFLHIQPQLRSVCMCDGVYHVIKLLYNNFLRFLGFKITPPSIEDVTELH